MHIKRKRNQILTKYLIKLIKTTQYSTTAALSFELSDIFLESRLLKHFKSRTFLVFENVVELK